MRIQSIDNSYGQKGANQQQPTFNGFFLRVGTGHKILTPNYYTLAGYIPFKDGNTKLLSDTYKEKPVSLLPTSEITLEIANAARKFLFEKVQNTETYQAAIKLKKFVAGFADKFTGEHNVLYMEKEDSGDPQKENWDELKLSEINSKLTEYEEANGISEKAVSKEEKEAQTYTDEELWEHIHRFGVA